MPFGMVIVCVILALVSGVCVGLEIYQGSFICKPSDKGTYIGGAILIAGCPQRSSLDANGKPVLRGPL